MKEQSLSRDRRVVLWPSSTSWLLHLPKVEVSFATSPLHIPRHCLSDGRGLLCLVFDHVDGGASVSSVEPSPICLQVCLGSLSNLD